MVHVMGEVQLCAYDDRTGKRLVFGSAERTIYTTICQYFWPLARHVLQFFFCRGVYTFVSGKCECVCSLVIGQHLAQKAALVP